MRREIAGPWIEYSRGPYSHTPQHFFAAGGFAPQETFEMIWIHFFDCHVGQEGQLLTSLADAPTHSATHGEALPHPTSEELPDPKCQ